MKKSRQAFWLMQYSSIKLLKHFLNEKKKKGRKACLLPKEPSRLLSKVPPGLVPLAALSGALHCSGDSGQALSSVGRGLGQTMATHSARGTQEGFLEERT